MSDVGGVSRMRSDVMSVQQCQSLRSQKSMDLTYGKTMAAGGLPFWSSRKTEEGFLSCC
jgi:uncharacterized membrane protein